MKAYYKGKITDGSINILPSQNRAFLYGDGFFETMIAHNGSVKFIDDHLNRLMEALSFLKITPPLEFIPKSLDSIIKKLYLSIENPEFSKIKIIAWRGDGGAYSPKSQQADFFISIESIEKPLVKELKKVGLSENVQNQYSSYSKFKSVSALNYVVAGLELKDKNLEDIIITDQKGHISECLVSNIFWVKNDILFTPSLKTGCIEGISRKNILKESAKQNLICKEVESSFKELLQADCIFTSNATGIAHILNIDNISFEKFMKIEQLYSPF